MAPDRQPFGAFLDRWLADVVRPSLRPRTSESYADLIRLHINPGLGRIPLAKLDAPTILRFLNERRRAGNLRREGGLSASSVRYLHAVIHKALEQAVRWNLIPRNPASLMDPPRVRRSEVTPLTPEQARSLLGAIERSRLGPLVTVALGTGMRQGELLGLRWEDVDLDAGAIAVRVQLQRVAGVLELVELKTDKSRRTIPLPGFAVAALRERRIQQLQDRLAAGADWQEWGLVFASLRGTPLDPKNVTHRFQDLLRRAGLPPMRFHDLRHGCATLLLAQGENLKLIQEQLGHSTISTTVDVYAHVLPEIQRSAADRLDGLLRAAR